MTSRVFTAYDPDTGFFSARYIGEPPEEGVYLEGNYDPREYVVIDGEAVKTPQWNADVGPNKITNIPAQTKGYLSRKPNEVFVINDGVLELDLIKGQMAFVVLQPPGCAPKEFQVYP